MVASEAFRTELEAVLARTARSRGRRPQGSPWRSRARGTAGLVFLFLRACRIALPEATALALLYAVIGAQLFTAIVTESYGFTLCKHPLPDLAAAQ